MRVLVVSSVLLLGAGLAVAQTQPDTKTPAPTPEQNELALAMADQLTLMRQQLTALSQLIAQNQRGLVVYPTALPLPGPIDCQGNCSRTVTEICGGVRYPRSYIYPAVVPSGTIGTYVNGVCFGP